MPSFEVTLEGKIYDVDAPNEQAAAMAADQVHRRSARPQTISQGRRELPRYGSMGGAVAGATAALPFAPALGPFAPIAPLAGAIMGGTGGEAWQQIAEQAYDWFTGGHTAPRSGTEAARGIREAIVPSGLGEVGGQTLGNIVTKVLGYIGRSRMTPAGRQLLETGKEAGFTPAVADLTQGKLVRPLEALSEKQVGGGRLTQAAEREIEAMRGAMVRKVLTFDEMVALYPETKGKIVAEVEESLCNGCGICEEVCAFDAIKVPDGLAVVDESLCEGCRLCVADCPTNALSLKNMALMAKREPAAV